MDDGLPLRTSRLTLRRIVLKDAAELLAIYGNEANAKHEFYGAWTADQVADLIYSQADVFLGDPGVPFVLVAIDSETDHLIGSVQLTINSVEDKQGELVGCSPKPGPHAMRV